MPPKFLTLEDLNREFKDKPVSFSLRGGKISLVATLPSRDGVGRKQQRISLGLGSNQIELEEARSRGYELFTQLVRGTFSWDKWDRKQYLGQETTGQLLERFKSERISQGIPPETLYAQWLVYQRLPQNRALTGPALIALLKAYPPDSSARRAACSHLSLLAKFAGIDVDLKVYRGSYTSHKVKPRDLPSDEEIEETWEAIATVNNRPAEVKSLRWIYGMMAAYGLRNHEVMLCEIDPKPPYVCRVKSGKTGAREVYPLPPEWVERFNLLEAHRPKIKTEGRPHRAIGEIISKKLRRTLKKLKKYHQPYETRHAYALRGELRHGLGTRVMSAMMGHSESNHIETYKRWLNKESIRRAYLEKVKPDP